LVHITDAGLFRLSTKELQMTPASDQQIQSQADSQFHVASAFINYAASAAPPATEAGNETPAIKHPCDQWLEAFLAIQKEEASACLNFHVKSAELAIRMGEAVKEADGEFSDEEVRWAQERLGMKASKWRKLRTIGKAGVRLRRHLDKLPPSWTVHYELAKLSVPQFEAVVAHHTFGPKMKAADIEAIVGTDNDAKKRKSEAVRKYVVADVTHCSPDEIDRVQKLLEDEGFNVELREMTGTRKPVKPQAPAFHSER
jgi:hypothetical protein